VNAYLLWGLKAIGAALGTFITAIIAATTDNSVTWLEWLVASCGAVVTGIGVFVKSNGPDPRPQQIAGTSITYTAGEGGGDHRSSRGADE
jgi:hypothetical protein